MKNPLWEFIGDSGNFKAAAADNINTLYFPLCNSHPFMSSVTPTLHGDSKTGNNSFLLEPVSRIDLSNSKSSRNFWVYVHPAHYTYIKSIQGKMGGVNPKKIWSATGVSKDLSTIKQDKFNLEAGLLWQKITRQNQKIGLKAEITSYVPATGEPVEIMLVNLTNITNKPIKFTPTASIPIYGRSSSNLRDHRHVTSLLNRISFDKFGVILTPTLLFDETGHKKNNTSYFVLGIDKSANGPEYIYPTQEAFCGDNSDLEAPSAVFNNLLPEKTAYQGKEAMGALRFKEQTLVPNNSFSYIILMGITNNKAKIKTLFNKFNTLSKVGISLEATRKFWLAMSQQIQINSGDKVFDHWFRWVSIQPALRKIFGCSFLPDFDYGKGGRGWRDLWQDCLYLTLTNPQEVRPLLINNFKGVRIDGSNATIIGTKPGEFIADRNNISRVWMDHGIWPWFTTLFYLHQSADLKILLEEIPYFKDQQICRSRSHDQHWNQNYGKELKTSEHAVYKGTILEHILVENLVQFFNVGPHNHIRLENADWNDGLDMAAEFGESVAFSAMYALNLKSLARTLKKLQQKEFVILEELSILIDTRSSNPLDYSKALEKIKLLDRYFASTKHEVSGKTVSLSSSTLIADLNKKAEWLTNHIHDNEWLEAGFFNGYYDNTKARVEGKIGGNIRMTLTGQVFPVMAGIAAPQQLNKIFTNAKIHLQDKKLGGFRLNSDFKNERLKLGRAFSFIYGDKENGAFFNHMSVMFSYALYTQGRAREGYEALNSIYKMSVDTKISKIYPCLPEYFNAEGRGLYCYLTGSASWFAFTLLTQSFGVRGEYGDLIIEPKLSKEQFKNEKTLSITTSFAGKTIEIRFINPAIKDFGEYAITKVSFNKKSICLKKGDSHFCKKMAVPISITTFKISRKEFLTRANKKINIIEITLE